MIRARKLDGVNQNNTLGKTTPTKGNREINSASALSTLTGDTTGLQTYVTKEMNRLQNMQNSLLGFTGTVANNTLNTSRQNVASGQNEILNNSTADLYASNLARQNYGIVESDTINQMASLVNEETASGISNVTQTLLKGTQLMYNLENKKRMLAVKEADSVFKIRKAVADMNLAWSQYDLSSAQLDYTKESNLRSEAISE